jgi:hypothetical protein
MIRPTNRARAIPKSVEPPRSRRGDAEISRQKQRSTNTGGGAVTTHKNDLAEEYFNVRDASDAPVRSSGSPRVWMGSLAHSRS